MSFAEEDERAWSPPRISSTPLNPNRLLLPPSSLNTRSSPLPTHSQHFTLFLSLANHIRDEAINNSEPLFANFLGNVRDHDVGIFASVTQHLGRGSTFAVRRTAIAEHKNVVFKSTLQTGEKISNAAESQRLETILLELRVLTHPPIRRHKNIVDLIQVGWEGDSYDVFRKWPVLVVEYADRGTLLDYFDHEPALPFSARRKLCSDVAAGLLALHDCGIVHGDIKLENVLVFSENGFVTAKLSDFGGSLLDSDTSESLPTPTRPWNAPEWRANRPKSQVFKSDTYSLGLLIWCIALNGANPFMDEILFPFYYYSKENLEILDAEKKMDLDFLKKVKQSVSRLLKDEDEEKDLLFSVFDISIRSVEDLRDLRTIESLLQVSDSEASSTSGSTISDEFGGNMRIGQDEPVPFSFGGLNFTAVTGALYPKVLESMTYALLDPSIIRRVEAAIALAMTNLASDDFGLVPNIDRGLNFLVLAAELGSREHRALALRMHEAFDRQIPESLASKSLGWLMEAAAKGSMTAAEDLKEHGHDSELQTALGLLQSRYCGTGEEIFRYDEEAAEALSTQDEAKCRDYLTAQTREARDNGRDYSGYLLRLGAAYGSPHASDILVKEFAAEINDVNSRGDTALLFAARCGHLSVLLALLRLGASPKSTGETDDTPLHWLCSFADKEVLVAATALRNAGADVDAPAEKYEPGDNAKYSETIFVAGTPLHRAVTRNKPAAVQALLDLGADVHSPAGGDSDMTPFALAVLLHYPHILRLFLSRMEEDSWLTTPSGKSILVPAIDGGSMYGATMGRLIRHGRHFVSRAEETLSILLQSGAMSHLPNLPGHPGCTAVFYASQCHVFVLEYLLRNGAKANIDEPSNRVHDGDEMRRPPLFEAVLWGKVQNISMLLAHGADPHAVMNSSNPISIIHGCAESGFEDLSIVSSFLDAGIGVDSGPVGFITPFVCSVLNRCFRLAEFLREKGANVNALFTGGFLGHSTRYPITILNALVWENSPGSVSCIEFLFRIRPGYQRMNLIVEPETCGTVFHVLAKLSGDSQDESTTRATLDLCLAYFRPTPTEINSQTLRVCDNDTVEDKAINTALHLAAIKANLPVVKFLLTACKGIDTSIRNAAGFTALDIAALTDSSFERWWGPRDVPQHPKKQLADTRWRRQEILNLLIEHTPGGIMENLQKYMLDSSDDEEEDPGSEKASPV